MAVPEEKGAGELKAYSVEEAAELLSVSPRTLRRYIKAGTIPSFRVGRQIRIRHEKLLDFIQEQERESEKA